MTIYLVYSFYSKPNQAKKIAKLAIFNEIGDFHQKYGSRHLHTHLNIEYMPNLGTWASLGTPGHAQ